MSRSLPKTFRIALDDQGMDSHIAFQFRVDRGVIRCACEHAHWELLYDDRACSLTARFERHEAPPSFGADGLIFGFPDVEWDIAWRREFWACPI